MLCPEDGCGEPCRSTAWLPELHALHPAPPACAAHVSEGGSRRHENLGHPTSAAAVPWAQSAPRVRAGPRRLRPRRTAGARSARATPPLAARAARLGSPRALRRPVDTIAAGMTQTESRRRAFTPVQFAENQPPEGSWVSHFCSCSCSCSCPPRARVRTRRLADDTGLIIPCCGCRQQRFLYRTPPSGRTPSRTTTRAQAAHTCLTCWQRTSTAPLRSAARRLWRRHGRRNA